MHAGPSETYGGVFSAEQESLKNNNNNDHEVSISLLVKRNCNLAPESTSAALLFIMCVCVFPE